MFKVTHGSVKYKDVMYGKNEEAGDIITGLSLGQEKSLEQKGYGEIIDPKTTDKTERKPKEVAIPELHGMTVDEIEELIEKTDDIETLYAMLEYEEENKKPRVTVIRPLEEKIVEIEEAEEGDAKPADDINVSLDPDEVVED